MFLKAMLLLQQLLQLGLLYLVVSMVKLIRWVARANATFRRRLPVAL